MRRGRFGKFGAGFLLLGLTLSRPSFAGVTTVVEPPREGTQATPEEGDSTEGASGEGDSGEGDSTEGDSGEGAKTEDTLASEPTGDSVAAVEDPDGDGSTPSDAELDARIAALREERRQYGLGGPITMMAVGGGVAFGALLIMRAACLGECETSRPVMVVGAVGLGVGIWGGVLLADRIGERRRNGREIKELERQKSDAVEVSVLPAVGPDAAALHVRLAF